MSRVVGLLCGHLFLLWSACQSASPPPIAKPKESDATVRSIEKKAQTGERHLNDAEKALDALEPDTAVRHLKEAQVILHDEKIDPYPDAKALRERLESLGTRVLAVREEIRRRELAALVKAAQEKIEAAKADLGLRLKALMLKDATTDAAKQAEEAIARAGECVDEARELETKDADYDKFAITVRQELAKHRDFVKRRHHEMSMAHARSILGEARTKLDGAIARVLAHEADDDAFKGADENLESFQKAVDEARKVRDPDADLTRACTVAQKHIEAVTKKLAGRRLQVAVARATKAIKDAALSLATSTKRLEQPDDFKAAEGAVSMLLKTLGDHVELVGKDRGFAALDKATRSTMVATKKRIEAQRLLMMEREQRNKVDAKMVVVESALKGLAQFSLSHKDFEAARAAVKDAKDVLIEGTELEATVPRYKEFARAKIGALKKATERIDRRQVEVEVRAKKLLMEDALDSVQKRAKAIQNPTAVEDDAKALQGAIEEGRKILSDGAPLEAKDAGYAKFTKNARDRLSRAAADLERARPLIAFRLGPIVALLAGKARLAQITGLGPKDEIAAFDAAAIDFSKCQTDAASALADHPTLAKAAVTVEKRAISAASVLSMCADLVHAASAKLEDARNLLAFVDGPIVKLESAKAKVIEADLKTDPNDKRGALVEALSDFEACVASGRGFLKGRPLLLKRTVEVAGKKVLTSKVVAACEDGAKAARARLKGSQTKKLKKGR